MDESSDILLDLAIEYAMKGTYRDGLTKEKKRAVRKKAQSLVIDKGEIYIKRKKGTVSLKVAI